MVNVILILFEVHKSFKTKFNFDSDNPSKAEKAKAEEMDWSSPLSTAGTKPETLDFDWSQPVNGKDESLELKWSDDEQSSEESDDGITIKEK